ncbi:MAG: large conductance mechanosensitive channel protein MscL [Bacilli bacterium]|nr:large conductance mechanosensitive channel protein MscL [Bacilli bacterium]
MSSKEEVKKVKDSGSKFINEFKTFILRGNVMDLAVGVLIGAAFQNLVTSLTTNIISPILGCFSEVDFNQFVLRIGKLELTYGAFITDVINFVIMAFVIFLIVKFMNFLQNVGKKPEPPKPEDIQLLEEIRDLLKNSDVKETKKKETKKKK